MSISRVPLTALVLAWGLPGCHGAGQGCASLAVAETGGGGGVPAGGGVLLPAGRANPATDADGTRADTVQVRGRHLLDTCGRRLEIRGVDQGLGIGFETPGAGGTLDATIDEIADTGANAVRFLPNMARGQLGLSRIEQLVARAVRRRMVVLWSLYSHDGTLDTSYGAPGTLDRKQFWARPDVKALVDRHRKWIIVDALQESHGDQTEEARAAWRKRALDHVAHLRAEGYTVPLTIMSNFDGRDLTALVRHGAEIAASDPLGKTILCWQGYWGSAGWYQELFGRELKRDGRPMTLAEGVALAARQPFPVLVDFDYETDPGQVADYAAGMTSAGQSGIGYTWWSYYHPWDRRNALSRDGNRSHLTSPFGPVVVDTHRYALRTAIRACGE